MAFQKEKTHFFNLLVKIDVIHPKPESKSDAFKCFTDAPFEIFIHKICKNITQDADFWSKMM
ncbi:hypothetical protein [Alkaliflexus imshenetskii]|uniref:hypothetical protein n=1 Tax=Alkaliflexus imshenetskii TaxID=286730 RepID=UPI0004B3E67C|nr:hypothetical protein [Alkaliflexus imshenetskii]